jgi:hypothetical protein
MEMKGKFFIFPPDIAPLVFPPDIEPLLLWRACAAGAFPSYWGEPGCRDPQYACSLCGGPIGTPDDDPRWAEHDEECRDCDICRDRVPVMLFRVVRVDEGSEMQRAQFHIRCFESIVDFKK